MIKNIIISITSLLASLFSYSQSYYGFSGGLLQPMAYKSIPNYERNHSSGGFNEKNSFYFSSHLKERLVRRYNFGFSFSFSYLDINFHESYSGKFNDGTSSDVSLTSYRLLPQLDMELAIIKKRLFLNFGPRVEIPIKAYSFEETGSYDVTGWKNSTWVSEGPYKTMWSVGVYIGLTLEKNIAENKIIFIRSQISYSLGSSYPVFKTYDLMLGAGIQFFLPNFIIGQFNENSTIGQPYILNNN